MNKYIVKLRVFIFCALTLAATYFALAEGVKWCWNLVIFKTWLSVLVFSIVVFSKDADLNEKLAKSYREGKHLPVLIDHIFYLAMVAALTAFGHFFYGAAYVFFWAIDVAKRKEALGGKENASSAYEDIDRAG